MQKILSLSKTAYLLGLGNIFRVLKYRLKIKIGWFSRSFSPVVSLQGPFFVENKINRHLPVPSNWQNEALYFGWWPRPLGDETPDWHQNPMNQQRMSAVKPWWKINDFDAQMGDIKFVWEASRFSWVLVFSQRALAGDQAALSRLNEWLVDWCEKNPPYDGINWKCGQEAAIRVMNVAMASVLLQQTEQPAEGLVELILLHMWRIAATLPYAMSQNNNHGTSEAAALFIGGSWLAKLGIQRGKHWEEQGRRSLEKQVKKLVGADGTFSQYSVNYHRVLLDTLCMVDIWRRQMDLPGFSKGYQSRAIAATHWLASMADPRTGEAPNIGANDGACLLALSASDCRDFRPAVQLAMVLFVGECAYGDDGHWNRTLAWFEIELPTTVMRQPSSQIFDDGGFAVLRISSIKAVMRYPRFRFRPSQADVMHVDLWKEGLNLLGDAGTYSYHTEQPWLGYFPGTVGHNTIQFDDRDQMPRLGRFLFGNWLKTRWHERIEEHQGQISFAAAYRDHKGAHHKRRVILTDAEMNVVDDIGGFAKKAILRWRLSPGNWRLEGTTVVNGSHSLRIEASMPIKRVAVVTGWESKYYMLKTEVPVLEVEVAQPGIIFSEYRWTS